MEIPAKPPPIITILGKLVFGIFIRVNMGKFKHSQTNHEEEYWF
jgi:hypothetical protein